MLKKRGFGMAAALIAVMLVGALSFGLVGCDNGTTGGNGGGGENNSFVPEYQLGDTGPGGGIIFYIADGQDSRPLGFTVKMANAAENYTAHYLEAAPNDAPNFYSWATSGYTSTFIPGMYETKLDNIDMGNGRRNTALILASDIYAPAALACKNTTSGGKNDWFLPSSEELLQLQRHYQANGKGTYAGLELDGWYWSSSQSNANFAQHRFMNTGIDGNFAKSSSNSRNKQGLVRAIRAF